MTGGAGPGVWEEGQAGKHGHLPEHPMTGVSAGHPKVGAGGAARQEGVQPEGPELMEKEADLQIALPRGVSVACLGKVGCQARMSLALSAICCMTLELYSYMTLGKSFLYLGIKMAPFFLFFFF